MKGYFYLIFVSILLTSSCRTSRPVANSNTTQEEVIAKPEWVSKRPVDYRYYIGIGIANKNNQLNYQQTAKKNAMEDLVSEIKVKIEGSSMLHQIDQNDKFREMYQSHVKTVISESIQDFEMVDSWENVNEYWVYYRLSKEKYEYEKRVRKEAAVKSAQDLLARGTADQENGLISNAIDYYLQGFQVLKEKNGTSYDPLLENEINATLKSLLAQIKIKFQIQELKVKRGFYQPTVVPALITYTTKSSKEFVASNLLIKGFFEKGKEEAYLTSDEKGLVYFSLASFKSNSPQLEYKAQIAGTTNSFKNKELAEVFDISGAVVNLPVKIITPSVYLEYSSDDKVAGDYLKKWLVEKNFILVKDKKTADLIWSLECDERHTEFNDFYTTFITANVRMYRPSNEEKLIVHMDEVKGVHLNKDASKQDANKKLGEYIQTIVYPKLNEYFMF